MRNIAFLKNHFIPKCSFSEKADAVQKYLLHNSSSALDIFILRSSSKKITVVTVVKNFLFSRSGCSVEVSLRKRSYFEKITRGKKWLFWKRRKSSCSEETAAPKKQLVCRSSYSEKMWRSRFSQNKVVPKKRQHMRERKSLFVKKKKPN